MKKNIFIIFIMIILLAFTSCDPSTSVAERLENNANTSEAPIKVEGNRSVAKSLNVRVESILIDHYNIRFTFLGDKKEGTLAIGETDGWVEVKETPNEWTYYLQQGKWKFEAEAIFADSTKVTFDPYEGYVNLKENTLELYIEYLLSTFDEDSTGSVYFNGLIIPALYGDKTRFYAHYYLLDINNSTVADGTVPMAEVKSGDGVATMEDFHVDDIPSGEYSVKMCVYELNQSTGLFEVKSSTLADGIKVYAGCRSVVTGTFGDTGNYLNATIRTYQASTTFTKQVDSTKLETGGNNTYDDFKFTCKADNPTNIRWFVDGVEQTEITCIEKVPVYKTHYYWKCPTCGHNYDLTTAPKTSGNKQTTCTQSVGGLAGLLGVTCGGKCTSYTQEDIIDSYRDVEVTKDADGTETEFTVRLSQMGHGNSGATTHYVECIYTDVEGHTSSSTLEMFVGSNYFPNLGASSIFVMGNGNEIDHWIINLTPDESLSNNGFTTFSSASGEVTVNADTGIWISEGLWVVNSATAYDSEGMALIETTTPTKTYVNKFSPYIDIENVIKSETTETGTIRIRDLKMNSLTWTCNYATGTIQPLSVDTDITIYKLTDDGKDDLNFVPRKSHIDGCTLVETGKTISGTSGGKNYSYHNDTYQIVGAETEEDFEVPEGTYRVQIKIKSGMRDGYIDRYKWGSGRNDWGESDYAGYTEGDLEVIVNVQAHTTQVVTGTLSCNHCVKNDGT